MDSVNLFTAEISYDDADPDRDKIGVWPGEEADAVLVRRADGSVAYYDGEL